MKIAWIGIGRMGLPMVERLLTAGHAVTVWNRTRAKAEPLVARGATLVDRPSELANADVVFIMVSTGKDLEAVCFGADGVATAATRPRIVVDCSSIGLEESARLRAKLDAAGIAYLAAPVSGNGKCVVAGKLSAVVSGPRAAFDEVVGLIETFAVRGASYVGEGELARICKIAHNVMLGVVIENLMEITLLAQKAGVPRHAFLKFMNDSVMGSIFTRYKTPALVNLDWTTTFTPALLRKDLDLGLQAARELGVPMPVTTAAREVLQMHFGLAARQPDPAAYIGLDFAAMLETMADMAGVTLASENTAVPTGLES
ncbi:MAG: NAD(P)-dependent oxidoreductase [Xanthobacteraceae bacterium]|nr:MAG: NAD(P)-dependent oxidoreductase [Xanthobacteraceae bacterium]